MLRWDTSSRPPQPFGLLNRGGCARHPCRVTVVFGPYGSVAGNAGLHTRTR